MKKYIRTMALATGFTLAATSASVYAADKVRPILLKTPIAFGSHLPALGTPIKWVEEQLPLISAGSVRMKIYEPGKLVAPLEILDAVSSGKINSGYATAGYWAGKMPAASLFSAIPFGPEAPEFMAWLYYGNGLNLYQKCMMTQVTASMLSPALLSHQKPQVGLKKKLTMYPIFKG